MSAHDLTQVSELFSAIRVQPAFEKLSRFLASGNGAAIAVSGGVDSMTLAHLAVEFMPEPPMIFHAVSPAVPDSATQRVREHAVRGGWYLKLVNAGEMDDPNYLANPVNRCYFCKANLYGFIRQAWSGELFSGANLDDLSDYRPGLIAAAEHRVRHPFIEAGVDKAGVRALARALGLGDLSELPAQPCLSSRVETGNAINPLHLQMIDRIESTIRCWLGPVDVRCRVRRTGLVIEIEERVLADLPSSRIDDIRSLSSSEAERASFAFGGVEPYQRGSAFVGDKTLILREISRD